MIPIPPTGWTGPYTDGNCRYDADQANVPTAPTTVIRLINNTSIYQDFTTDWEASDTFTITLNACEVWWKSADAGNGVWISLRNTSGTEYFTHLIELDGTHAGEGVAYTSWQANQTFSVQVTGQAMIDGSANGNTGFATAGEDLRLNFFSKSDSDSINWIDNVSLTMPGDETGYSAWISGYGLTGDDALAGADVENGAVGDGYDNLAEYALGMNPTVTDAGSRDWAVVTNEDGTNWFQYIYYRRIYHEDDGLDFIVLDSFRLESGTPSTNTQDQILIGPAVDGYEPVTNRYQTDESEKFIKLEIWQN